MVRPVYIRTMIALPLHLIGHFNDPHAGAERGLLELAAGLSARRPLQLWSDVPPHQFFEQHGVRHIRPFAGEFPKTGMALFAGSHVEAGIWLEHAGLSRVALGYNLPNHGALFSMLQRLQDACGLEPEIMFVSRALQEAVGLPGVIEPSLIDIEPFLAIDAGRPARSASGRFTVGRLSRDVPEKHHSDDASLYRLLAAQGIQVRVMGGTCLRASLADVNGVELLPAGAEATSDFLASLDVFFYRTGTVYEAYGRVIFEAMASALPVVAGMSGGYAEWVVGDHGVALVASQEQAFQILMALANDVDLRQREGQKARLQAMTLHSPQVKEAVLVNYLR